MPKLKTPTSFETTFGTYVVDELLGEGGAGRVYGGIGLDGAPIALKILAGERATADKRHRFKNEIAFQARNKHKNIVSVIDNGIATNGETVSPFYVMRRYQGSLRDLIRSRMPADVVLPLFGQILDGIEAAHLQRVIHRDLKPENILYDPESNTLVIADFGTARFTEELVATVQTAPGQRLANFQYAAPEQRTAGRSVGATADIYALGLILNEMFTGEVPHGTDYRLIARVASESAFLDDIVARMLRQAPEDRPSSITDVKGLIQRYKAEAVSLQKLSRIDGTVIEATRVDEPLAEVPPKLISADWNDGQLILTLDKPVSVEWINALNQMGSYSAVMGKPPQAFSFSSNQAFVNAAEHEVQLVIDNFKTWLPAASLTLKSILEREFRQQEAARTEQLRRARQAEEARLRVLRNMKI